MPRNLHNLFTPDEVVKNLRMMLSHHEPSNVEYIVVNSSTAQRIEAFVEDRDSFSLEPGPLDRLTLCGRTVLVDNSLTFGQVAFLKSV